MWASLIFKSLERKKTRRRKKRADCSKTKLRTKIAYNEVHLCPIEFVEYQTLPGKLIWRANLLKMLFPLILKKITDEMFWNLNICYHAPVWTFSLNRQSYI